MLIDDALRIRKKELYFTKGTRTQEGLPREVIALVVEELAVVGGE